MAKNLEAALKRMDQLQIAFLAKLGERVKELSHLILQLDAGNGFVEERNRQLLTKINLLSHNLAGSAGTFKQTAVYNKAKAIENLTDEILKPADDANHVHQYRILLELITALRADVQISGRPLIVENFSSVLNQQDSEAAADDDGVESYPVIVVDDDELLVNLIQEQAKHFDYKVIPLLTTADLEQAIEEHQPSAILMDVVFPDARHSGVEIINQLKAKQKINCPVIFMSNRSDTEVRLDALRAGSNAFIVKPLEILELIRVLDRVTKKLSKKKSRILIVDDEPLTAQLYETILNENGFNCCLVLDPIQIMHKALVFEPDVILLDITMPSCNGFEIAEIIRQDDNFAHVPILFLTATNTCQREIQAMKSGGDDFLDKSADISTIVAIIKGHVQRYKELNSVLTRLKRDEIRFRSVTSSSHDAIITVDNKGRIVFWNEGAETIFGYHALEAIGQPVEMIVPPEHREKHALGFQQLVDNHQQELTKRSIESTAIRKDRSYVEIELTYTEWASGAEKFYTSILRDISDRKITERQLKHKEASLAAIVANSGEGIITIDNKGIIETVNAKAAQLFDYQADELIGQNVSILVPSPEKERHDEYVINSELHAPRIINTARELNGERKDGSLFALELNVSPMMVDEQRKFVGILHDVSERKKMMQALLLAKEEAEMANRAKTQFLSSMSHELRTPLNAILGFTQLLQTDEEHSPSADQLDSLNHIYDAGMHLLSLITEVLDLSKIEMGAVEIVEEKIFLPDFLNSCITQINPLATKAGISINKFTYTEPMWVMADKVKLKQVINNLLSNAIKYNKPNGLIMLTLEQIEHNVRLSVTDTGKGISDKLLADLFKPFNRLGAESTNIEGTGIGLTITKKLIEMMGGKIGVSSEVERGSTFWIELKSFCA